MSDDEETTELAKLLGKRLIARRDVFPVQSAKGAYSPARTKKLIDGKPVMREDDPTKPELVEVGMRDGHLVKHLLGKLSVGHYLIEPGSNTTKMFAFDIDADKGEERDAALEGDPEVWAKMLSLGHGLASWARTHLRVKSMVSYGGGKGLHVICPVRGRANPEKVKLAAEGILADGGFRPVKGKNFWGSTAWDGITVEVFPKQVEVADGSYGNLMRLPLGVNRKTGNEAYFVPAECMTLGVQDDPIATLTEGTWR